MLVAIIMVQTHQVRIAFEQEHVRPADLMTGCCLGVKYKQRELMKLYVKWLCLMQSKIRQLLS